MREEDVVSGLDAALEARSDAAADDDAAERGAPPTPTLFDIREDDKTEVEEVEAERSGGKEGKEEEETGA